VSRVAGGGLLDVRDHELFVRREQIPDVGTFLGNAPKMVPMDHRGRSRDLYDDLVHRRLVVERLCGTDYAVRTDHEGLDHRTVVQADHERDDAGVGEIDLLDLVSGTCENGIPFKRGDPEMRFECSQVSRIQRLEQNICHDLLHPNTNASKE